VPIYDFKCEECGKVSEILIRSANDQDVSCPDCGNSNMDRLISSSYLVKMGSPSSGATCCGRAERCDTPSCSTGEGCRRH